MLVFFSWTAVESVFLFIKLVKVVGGGISRYNLKAGLLAWSKCSVVHLMFVKHVPECVYTDSLPHLASEC